MNRMSLIAGEWKAGEGQFDSEPTVGNPESYSRGSVELINEACEAAEVAFASYGYSSRAKRAEFLRKIADEIDSRGDEITRIGTLETGLPAARIQGERGRTVGQLRLFADHIELGDYLDRRHDPELSSREPIPRPELKMLQRPVGPVAVFGASNFPLAFSTAGGDTAAALAAGCPVVVKGHPAHPGTGEIVATAVNAAREASNLSPGVFSFVHDGGNAVGAALVQHPFIKAVGFTGSLLGGRALFDLCAARAEPIPFFGELGSVNPVFVLPDALHQRAKAIGKGWASSLTLGAGQFCTNPGVIVVVKGRDADTLVDTTADELLTTSAQTMLTARMASAFREGRDAIAACPQVNQIVSTKCVGRQASPQLFSTTGEYFMTTDLLAHEVLGPLGVVVRVDDFEQMKDVAQDFVGQLTMTLQMDDGDKQQARDLVPILDRKAGRLLVNNFPTGVEVADSMVHGGPYPASTNFGATSVGTLSIRRFLRPVCYQDMPDEIVEELAL
jgi:NADP-dependent aldehyde dehydrogenase